MIIDSHQHFWQLGRFDYPWMNSSLGVLYRDYLPDQLEPILGQNRVGKTVVVQASNSVEESRWLLNLADEHPFIAGVVGWVDLGSDDVDRQLDELVPHPKFKGVRHLVESEPADDWLIQPQVLRGLKRLSTYGVSYDLLVHTRHLKYIQKVVDACPDLKLVIDHMAKPPIANGEIETWRQELRQVAANEQIYCKLSGLVTEANWTSWTKSDLRPYVDCALELFGSSRLLFGSDHPVCLLAASYEQVLASFRELLNELGDDEEQKIFGSNAAEFYGLNG
ncbi:MAG TPA: amidohydrolase family protein [Pyrinomonadaceae bacterium]|nr:amidohydrolase family protein [Pyrinomonadaceae bacterium]